MSITNTGTSSGDLRPFPVRFDPVQRERLDLLAQLTGRSATDIVREGTVRLLDALSASPTIRARVDDHIAQIRKEADARQAAVNAMFGIGEPDAEEAAEAGAEIGEELDGDDTGDEGEQQLDLTNTDSPDGFEENGDGGATTDDADTSEPTPAAPAKKTTSSRRSSRSAGLSGK